VLPRRTISGSISSVLHGRVYLAPIDADIPQLPIAETAQDHQGRLVLTLGDDACDPSVDEAEKPSCNGLDYLPSVRGVGVVRAAVQQRHCLSTF